MIKKEVQMIRGFSQDELIGHLAGGFSLRVPEEVAPVPESFLPIARETLEIVESLCDVRGFDYHSIWERLLIVFESVDMEIRRVNSDEDLETVPICHHLGVALHDYAKQMDLPIEDLINSGVIKLKNLLHVVDDEEYAAIQKIDKKIRGIRPQVEGVMECLDSDLYNSSIDLSSYIRQAEDVLYEAQKVIDSYLSDHAVSPNELTVAPSEIQNSQTQVSNHECH